MFKSFGGTLQTSTPTTRMPHAKCLHSVEHLQDGTSSRYRDISLNLYFSTSSNTDISISVIIKKRVITLADYIPDSLALSSLYYSTFCAGSCDEVEQNNLTMHIHHKPNNLLEVMEYRVERTTTIICLQYDLERCVCDTVKVPTVIV